MVKVMVVVQGGNVVNVQCNDSDAVVRIIDYDNKSDDGTVDHSEADWMWPNTQLTEEFDTLMGDDFDLDNSDKSKGTFTSVWDDGTVLETALVEYDVETGEIQADVSKHDPDSGLIREFITLPNGDDLEVCTNCHCHVLRTVLVNDTVGKGLHEEKQCPECDLGYTNQMLNGGK